MCTLRPAVTVDTTASGNSLRVDLAATGQHNRLLTLQSTQATLFFKLYDVAPDGTITLPDRLVSPVRVPRVDHPISVSLPGNTTSTSFYVLRATAGAATAMLTVVDRCGSWSTFVGGGPSGGF